MIDEAPSLYELLPRYIRFRDQSLEGAPLEAVMNALQVTFDELHTNIGSLWDAWFIETCAPWLVPYLGDLIGVRGLDDPAHSIISQRAQVANTIAFRRRRGTLAVLEEAAGNATGRAVLARDTKRGRAFCQHVDAVEPARGGTLDLRQEPLPFQAAPVFGPGYRNVRISGTEARCLKAGVELALGEVQSYPVTHTFARPVPATAGVAPPETSERHGRVSSGRITPGFFKLSPWGIDIPLYQRPTTPHAGIQLHETRHLPLPIGRVSMRRWLHALAENHAIPETLGSVDSLYIESGSIGAAQVLVADLSSWRQLEDPQAWPDGRELAIDPRLGRFVFRRPRSLSVPVAYTYGAMMDLGGGPYERQEARPDAGRSANWKAIVFRGAGLGLAELLLGLSEPECLPKWEELCLLALVEMAWRGKPENPAIFDSVRQALDFWGYHHVTPKLPDGLTLPEGRDEAPKRLRGSIVILDSALYSLFDGTDESTAELLEERCSPGEPYSIPLYQSETLSLTAAQGHCPFVAGRIHVFDAGHPTDPAGSDEPA
ncbi:MAG: phage tail protein, partial [Holophagales bacterium]|nr:phage tail protein [Holophagales bacterium]